MRPLTKKQSSRLEAFLLKELGLEVRNEVELMIDEDGLVSTRRFKNMHYAQKEADRFIMSQLKPGTVIEVS